ncbi:MAG: hypothetical protein WDO71_03560 [Bacteroidota bacterium]
MARNWDALILNDYEAVMPLTWNKNMAFSIYTSHFLPHSWAFLEKPLLKN